MTENPNYSESSPVFGKEHSSLKTPVFAILNIKRNICGIIANWMQKFVSLQTYCPLNCFGHYYVHHQDLKIIQMVTAFGK
jgi:hypothetical protein